MSRCLPRSSINFPPSPHRSSSSPRLPRIQPTAFRYRVNVFCSMALAFSPSAALVAILVQPWVQVYSNGIVIPEECPTWAMLIHPYDGKGFTGSPGLPSHSSRGLPTTYLTPTQPLVWALSSISASTACFMSLPRSHGSYARRRPIRTRSLVLFSIWSGNSTEKV